MSHNNETPETHLIHLEAREKTGSRIYSPTGARNKGPLAEVLAEHLNPNARVLEIASGTGEHAVEFCKARPDIYWMPSDPDAESRASILDWSSDCAGRIAAPLDLDMRTEDWWSSLERFDVVYNANMIHIAPIQAAIGLARGAGQRLKCGGQVILYGPFLFGPNSAQSNIEFDARLKLRNPTWGVRELGFVKDIFSESGLNFHTKIAMPANNHCLIFEKT